jgi:2-oxoacid:acceptor oxidoreductase delta subunit (pyruvate/2-ketoisovalerate family)
MDFKLKYEGPFADFDNMLTLPTGSWRYQRPATQTNKCCHCGWCLLFCPTGSIEDKGTYLGADLNSCKGCGVCAKVCPVNAIMMVSEL